MNGGEEKKYPGEEWVLVNSPKVSTYDLKPEMTPPNDQNRFGKNPRQAIQLYHDEYANPTWWAHRVVPAILSACEVVDHGIANLQSDASKTALCSSPPDHGNCENVPLRRLKGKIIYQNGAPKPSTEHFQRQAGAVHVYGPKDLVSQVKLRPEGVLADLVAPTVLEFYGLPKPAEMPANRCWVNYKKRRRETPVILIFSHGWGCATRKRERPELANTATSGLQKNIRRATYPVRHAVGPRGRMGNSKWGT